MTAPVTVEALDTAVAALSAALAKLPSLTPDLGLETLLEIAAEADERGPLATITGLLQALRVRHGGDDTTLAILAAMEHYHLPALMDGAKG